MRYKMFDYDIFEYFMKDFEKQLKGIAGESIIQLLLNSPQLGYRKILKNIYVPYGNQTTEIDVVMIHETGIYVIESKNYSGWIFGSENQQQWTQMLNSYTKKRFYNPIWQNRTHIRALSNYTNIDKSKIKSYIVFSDRCELKAVPPNTSECIITKIDLFLYAIYNDINNRKKIFTVEEVNQIEEKLKPITNVSQEVKNKHIQDIEKNKK